MVYIKIRNIYSVTKLDPPLGYISRLDFWENKKGKQAANCEVKSCSGNAELGGHVLLADNDRSEYVIAMCSNCNNKPNDEIFEVLDSILIPVNETFSG